MKREICWISSFIVFVFLFSTVAFASPQLTGEISGTVVDKNGEVLPGVTITLSGEKLFQKSLFAVSNEKGIFRFLSLNPGDYELIFTLQGFNTLKIEGARVNVGKNSPIRAALTISKIDIEVAVVAETPLIETKSTQMLTSFTSLMISNVPTSRNLLDLMDSVPGINDKGAFGSGGNQDTGSYGVVYSQGSATSSYLFNNVDVSDAFMGTTWVNPAQETIEEIQVVGIGASAENGGFIGASFNVVTKSGSNKFKGGVSAYYTDSRLYGDNSGGNLNLKPGDIKYSPESVIYLGGPLIKEKLFFFLAGGYTGRKMKGYYDYAYGTLDQAHFQLKLDWLANKRNSFSFIINYDPLDHLNLGQRAGSGPEIAYDRIFRSTTLYASWQSTPSDKTIFDLKYAGFIGRDEKKPKNPGVLTVNDRTTNRRYGSSVDASDLPRSRNQVNASVTHYLDEFLGASHEFKFGLSYEHHYAEYNYAYTGPGGSFINIYRMTGTYGMVVASTGVSRKNNITMNGISGYAQDNVQIGSKVTLNLGLRFDIPRLSTEDVLSAHGKYSIGKYTNISPRFGFSYDFGGNARYVGHVNYGRYYQKMLGNNFWGSLPGSSDASFYRIYLDEPFVYSKENAQQLFSRATQPQNLLWTRYSATLWDVSTTSSPYTDVFNIGFEMMLGKDFSLSLDYIHKRDRNFIQQSTLTKHTYQEVEWVDPWLKNTIKLWKQTDTLPDTYYYDNGSYAKRNHNFLMAVLQKREIGKWSMMASFTYQRSEGNISNDAGEALGSGAAGRDTDPYYTNNPLMWGICNFDRTFQFKLLGTYFLPFGFTISGDLKLLSGTAWTPTAPYYYTPISRQSFFTVLLEQRGSRRHPMDKNLNLRLAKKFKLKGSSNLELQLDILNVFNGYDATYYSEEPFSVYSISRESSFGLPTAIGAPRRALLGIRFTF